MPDNNKTSISPFIDPAKLGELMRLTKQRLSYQDEIEALSDEITKGAQLRLKEQIQHERDLSLLLRANSRIDKPQPIGGGGLLSSYVGSYIHNINANREEHDEINAQGIAECACVISATGCEKVEILEYKHCCDGVAFINFGAPAA